MNDSPESQNTSQFGSTLLGFALGAVMGAGLALMLAPASGDETRRRLAAAARRSGQLAGDAFEQARAATGDAIDQARTATGTAIDQARTATGGAIDQARTAAGDLGDDVLTAVQAGRDSFAKNRAGR